MVKLPPFITLLFARHAWLSSPLPPGSTRGRGGGGTSPDARGTTYLCLLAVLALFLLGTPLSGAADAAQSGAAGKSLAKVGDRPAVTLRPQQIDLRNGILLFDTPGLLWPAMIDQGGAYRLAASGAIGANALDYTNVGIFAAAYMMRRYPELLKERYKLAEIPEGPHEVVEAVGRCLGCLMSGGVVDVHRAAETFLRELRAGKAGRISFEEPDTPADIEAELLKMAGIEVQVQTQPEQPE